MIGTLLGICLITWILLVIVRRLTGLTVLSIITLIRSGVWK